MSINEGFADLRINLQEGQNQESFWPSFTDIMTVIVMIFMIAMVVLLVRNMELVTQLRATMETERQAIELARSKGEEKESLTLILMARENELALLQSRLKRTEGQRRQQEQTIGSQEEQLAGLQADNEALTLRRDQLSAENFSLNERLKQSETTVNSQRQEIANLRQDAEANRLRLNKSQTQVANLQADISSMKMLLDSIQQQLGALEARYKRQSKSLQLTKATERTIGREYNTLQSEYQLLKVKYNRLVRPARSPDGRYMVEVKYTRADGKLKIEYKSQDNETFRRIDKATLEQKLSALKKSNASGLYVKVIFPEDSGLSQSEAWRLTIRLHSNYDYYFQDSTEPVLVPDALPVE
ncbi:MAG: hypothetical protein GY696_37350 [Gammaproteobacteria bacterium]|nr:hypothetical protein [Gammaproteobacteria bacterium]